MKNFPTNQSADELLKVEGEDELDVWPLPSVEVEIDLSLIHI